MTDKAYTMTTHGPAKMPGWFSWRHQTRDAHDRARETYLAAHGPEARRRRAQERTS